MSKTPFPATALASVLLASPAVAAPVLPDFGAARFEPGAAIDNPYFPVTPGVVRSYEGSDEDGATERTELSHAGAGPELLGVQTTTLLDRVLVDGAIVEETFDYYAQDIAGNVWYFGEDVTNYRYDEAGTLLGTDSASAWLAGANDALPGYILPVDREVGFNYYQEFAEADEAIDQGTIFATGETVTIGLGTYDDVLVILDTNPLEPDARELKHFAPGIGRILAEEDLDTRFENPALRPELVGVAQPSPIPLPAGLPLLAGALAGLTALGRRASRRRTLTREGAAAPAPPIRRPGLVRRVGGRVGSSLRRSAGPPRLPRRPRLTPPARGSIPPPCPSTRSSAPASGRRS